MTSRPCPGSLAGREQPDPVAGGWADCHFYLLSVGAEPPPLRLPQPPPRGLVEEADLSLRGGTADREAAPAWSGGDTDLLGTPQGMAQADGAAPGQPSVFKLVLLGGGSVGKSSLALRFAKGDFKSILPTVGCAFFTKLVDVGAASVKLEIWDTAGQEKYHSVCHLYFRGADAALLVYDITSKDSFCKAQQWLRDLEKELPLGDVVVMLVGNKTDLEEEREVSVEEGAEFAASQCLLFMETSARLNHQVTEAFHAVAQELVRRAEEKAEKQTPRGRAQLAANQAPGAARCCGH